MGVEPRRVKHLRLAHEMGLGNIDLEKIEVVGTELHEVVTNFELPSIFHD